MQTEENTVDLEAIKTGNVAEFEKLFKYYYQPLCRYAYTILGDRDEAEDIVQQTLVNVWDKRMKLQVHTALRPYLYRSVHNGALNHVRRQATRVRYQSEQEGAEPDRRAESASTRLMQTELEKEIGASIEKLPEQCRMVFKLSRFSNLKYSEIAEHLGISIKTVENHMGKALKLLRSDLRDYLVWLLPLILMCS